MSFFLTSDSLRIAAALWVRASAGSGWTALVLLVLVGTTGLGGGSSNLEVRCATAVVPADSASRSQTSPARPVLARAPIAVQQGCSTGDRDCRVRRIEHAQPPTRGP